MRHIVTFARLHLSSQSSISIRYMICHTTYGVSDWCMVMFHLLPDHVGLAFFTLALHSIHPFYLSHPFQHDLLSPKQYIFKGPDQCRYNLVDDDTDEILEFRKAQYHSSTRAAHQLFGLPVCLRSHMIYNLPVHEEGKQSVMFGEDVDAVIDSVLDKGSRTQLTEFFRTCATDKDAENLLYEDIYQHYTWDSKELAWNPRCTEKQRPIFVRLDDFTRNLNSELYFLRLLLLKVRGPASFLALRTYEGVPHPTFKSACIARGFCFDTGEWEGVFTEAAMHLTEKATRQLFVSILAHSNSFVNDPTALFDKFITYLIGDFLSGSSYRPRREARHSDTDLRLYATARALHDIYQSLEAYHVDWRHPNWPEDRVLQVLHALSATPPQSRLTRLYCDFTHNDIPMYASRYTLLSDSQRGIVDCILAAVNKRVDLPLDCPLFTLLAAGGVGKTFVINCLLGVLALENKVTIVVASTGIAATLLFRGRTAHSVFKIPLDIDDNSTCGIPMEHEFARIIEMCALLVWDEIACVDRYCVESVDRLFRHIKDKPDTPFGGVTVLLSGDLRQLPAIVEDSSRTETVAASIKSSYLWGLSHFFALTENKRVQNMEGDDQEQYQEFLQFLTNIGDGVRPQHVDESPFYDDSDDSDDVHSVDYMSINDLQDFMGEGTTDFSDPFDRNLNLDPSSYLVHIPDVAGQVCSSLDGLIAEVYPDLVGSSLQQDYFSQRLILTPLNRHSTIINDLVLDRIPGRYYEMYSSDSVPEDMFVHHKPSQDELNNTVLSNFPLYRLKIKVGCVVVLLRNLHPEAGLVNSARLVVLAVLPNLIQVRILTGAHRDSEHFLHRITLTSDPDDCGYSLRRHQFPVLPAACLSIHKGQGQSLNVMGIYLPVSLFEHGHMYVAWSRSTDPKKLFYYIHNDEQDTAPRHNTNNIVYPELLLDFSTLNETVLTFNLADRPSQCSVYCIPQIP